eukprot:651656-Prorocentrum_minimum.AAC.1
MEDFDNGQRFVKPEEEEEELEEEELEEEELEEEELEEELEEEEEAGGRKRRLLAGGKSKQSGKSGAASAGGASGGLGLMMASFRDHIVENCDKAQACRVSGFLQTLRVSGST